MCPVDFNRELDVRRKRQCSGCLSEISCLTLRGWRWCATQQTHGTSPNIRKDCFHGRPRLFRRLRIEKGLKIEKDIQRRIVGESPRLETGDPVSHEITVDFCRRSLDGGFTLFIRERLSNSKQPVMMLATHGVTLCLIGTL